MKELSGRCALAAVATIVAAIASSASAQSEPPSAPPLKGTPVRPARLPDGHPNWTGFWISTASPLANSNGSGSPTGPRRPGGAAPFASRNVPPIKSPYKEQQAETLRAFAAGQSADPEGACFPPGMPRMMWMVYGMEILQTPKVISITSEWQAATRRIWMDVKAHPPADELEDTYAGDSIGHWEGDTLVIDTIGIRKDVPLDNAQIPHSPKLKITERFHEVSPGVLIDDVTVVDPDVFDTPWKYNHTYLYKSEDRIREYVCLENNRNMDAQGRAVFK